MKKIYKIEGLDCINCANQLEKKLKKAKIVNNLSIDYLSETISIENEIINDVILNKLQDIIIEYEPDVNIIYDNNTQAKIKSKHNTHKHHKHEHCNCEEHHSCSCDKEHISNNETKSYSYELVIGIITFLLALICYKYTLISITFSFVSYFIIGYDILLKFLKNLKKGQIFDENFLMTIATIGAIFIGEYTEACAVMLFYRVGEMLQDKAVKKSRKSIIDLIGVKKKTATIESKGNYKEIPLESISIGSEFIVKPGEIVPIDGVIIDGTSNVDLSSLTGESNLIEKTIGDEILSGSINNSSILKIKAKRLYKDSTISKILDIVENSSNRKAKQEKFITKFARIYTPVVCIIALLLFAIPTYFLGFNSEYLYKALSFLVVSCPCALVISIPLSFFSGIGACSRKGILVKGSNFLDEVTCIDYFIFDKTGTLTNGNFKVTNFEILLESSNIESIIYSLEKNSTHPIAKSIVEEFKGNKVLKVNNYKEIPGKGIKGDIDNITYYIGNSSLLKDIESLSEIEFIDENVIYLSNDKEILAKISISDGIKEDSFKLMNYLKEKNVYMLTGDNEENASYVASKLDIKSFKSSLLPIDKVEFIKDLDKDCLFIGDGINDAPVLKSSNIGISMGSTGSDAAIEVSDVVFVEDDIYKLKDFIEIGKFTKKIVKQNIFLAIFFKILVLGFISFGISTMWMAIFADVGISLLCILNSFRILLKKY